MISLFEHYPRLANKLPYVLLGEFPTPVKKLDRLGRNIGLDKLYIKEDSLSGKPYGGNKVRKLETILGQALRNQAKEVLTFGFAGSHQAMATAIYAQQVGLKSISMLIPQANAHYVRQNLLMTYHCGSELHHYRNLLLLIIGVISQLLRHKLKYGRFPHLIPPGGTSPLGVAGFVNAAFELKQQIIAGDLPEPDRIYVALGTMGTVVGLMLGLKAANLRSQVTAVRIVDSKYVSAKRMIRLFHKSNSFLHALDPSFPIFLCKESDIDIRHGFVGPGYGHFTEEGMAAVRRMKETEGIDLEGTYTGKTLAALIDDAKKRGLSDEAVLFWNTYDSRDFSDVTATVDYRQLPACLHRYYEEEVQPLDKGAWSPCGTSSPRPQASQRKGVPKPFHSGTHFSRVTVGKIVGTSQTFRHILSQLHTTIHKSQTRCLQGGCRLSVVRPTT